MKIIFHYVDGSTYTVGNVESYSVCHSENTISMRKKCVEKIPSQVFSYTSLVNSLDEVLYAVCTENSALVEIISGLVNKFSIVPCPKAIKKAQDASSEMKRIIEAHEKRNAKNRERLRLKHRKAKK